MKSFLKITGSYVKKVINGWRNTGKDIWCYVSSFR